MELIADERTCTRYDELARELGELTGRRSHEIARALYQTKAMKQFPRRPGCPLTQRQAETCIALMERWIRQAKGRTNAK